MIVYLKLSRAGVGNYFDLKHNLICLAELKEFPVGNKHFFAGGLENT